MADFAPEPIEADVCLVIEGAYPYVTGGVSSWCQDLIQSQCHLTFHLVVIVAPGAELKVRYKLPPNVSGITNIYAAYLPPGARSLRGDKKLLDALHGPVSRVMAQGDAKDLVEIIRLLRPHRDKVGRHLLLDSPEAWRSFCDVYDAMCQGASFINAFWGFRTLLGGLYGTILSELPPARIYHCISTGYAGLFAARAAFETGRPALVTEHGVYTNERRLEILAAPWLAVDDSTALAVDGETNKIKEMWINTFVSYSRACYQACTYVISLFEGNYALQVEDGASPDRLCIIPNGIDVEKYSRIVPGERPETNGKPQLAIGLVGRVVPIKDIKTYVRACALLVKKVPNVVCYILGPMDEDPEYAQACQALAAQLGLGERLVFAGMVNLVQWYGKIDVMVLTSISEAQPLVILEAGAAGVPSVATDVGACREIIQGRSDESPPLGSGGRVAQIGNPGAVADGIAELLLNAELRKACGETMRQRVIRYYDIVSLRLRYAQLYDELLALTEPDYATDDKNALLSGVE
ncbi:MAG: GT4 family glycosyltransferase PelF [Deltaproteobacteria bacterium]|nr:GT4 family glycosyltransferase PelF [Deltaproteobacteria bacterium]